MGIKLYSKLNYSEALNYFNLSLNQNSSNTDAWIHKGDSFKALGKLNASIDSYNQALKHDRKKVAAWSGLANSYATSRDYVNASFAATKATEFDSKNKANWLREGYLLQIQGMFKEAISKFDGALKLDAKYKDALYRKALSLIASNNTIGCEELLDHTLALDPNYKYAYNAKGQTLETQGRYADALAAYNKALELDPRWRLAMSNKMHALLALNRWSDAIDLFVKMG